MKIKIKNLKLVLTNYRWYIAVLWALFLIPVYFVPMLIITFITSVLAASALFGERVVLAMVDFSENTLSWAARWFEGSINPDDVDKS